MGASGDVEDSAPFTGPNHKIASSRELPNDSAHVRGSVHDRNGRWVVARRGDLGPQALNESFVSGMYNRLRQSSRFGSDGQHLGQAGLIFAARFLRQPAA